MSTFRIEPRIRKVSIDDDLLKYPDVPFYDQSIFFTSFFGKLYFDFDGNKLKKLKHSISISDDNCLNEYLSDFYLRLLNSIPKVIKGQQVEIGMTDSGNCFILKPENDKILITFYYDLTSEESNIKNFRISLDQFVREAVRSAQEFVEKIVEINPKLENEKHISEIIKLKEKIQSKIKKP